MLAHWRNLKYILRHKRLVYRAGRKLDVSRVQLLVHDFQKFLPAEWGAYTRKFFTDEQRPHAEFEQAWLHHQRLGGKHHWQYWIQVLNYGELKPLQMPERYVREMLADWTAMGWANGVDSAVPWYEKNRDKMILHPKTEKFLDELMAPWIEGR